MRGWSRHAELLVEPVRVLPAHAGMVPSTRAAAPWSTCAPRACGDGPRESGVHNNPPACSPRMRGWSPVAHEHLLPGVVLPAHAGMVPARPRRTRTPPGAPRACGDGPRRREHGNTVPGCSPRMRGWSRPGPDPQPRLGVLPAHAGMVPCSSRQAAMTACAPRACGDGPPPLPINPAATDVLPAHAGMVPQGPGPRRRRSRAPRVCGDGPATGHHPLSRWSCSPRMRGWSHDHTRLLFSSIVLPAHAGMVPDVDDFHLRVDGAPRACGDGPRPSFADSRRPRPRVCSPRMRGWSRDPASSQPPDAVLPAHAGMVPNPQRGPRHVRECSPRMRGWSPTPREDHAMCESAPRACGDGPQPPERTTPCARVLPAHAGMVPNPQRGPRHVRECSPRMRGWSPTPREDHAMCESAPRACGDGPFPVSSFIRVA